MLEGNSLIALICIVFSAASAGSAIYVAFSVRPWDLYRRLDEVENCAPWAIARQELNAWTLHTDDLLEDAGVKLKRAALRENKNARKKAAEAPEDPSQQPPMDRHGQLQLVRQQLGMR